MSNAAMPSIALTHGQARWVLRYALSGTVPNEATFDSYLKYLRRSGIPFSPAEAPGKAGINAIYGFEHLMEMGFALLLGRQGILKGDIVRLLVRMRDELRPLYRQAWTERETGLGARISAEADGERICMAMGLWLDLGLTYNEGGGLSTSDPKLLGPRDAISLFCTTNLALYHREPVRVSDLAAEIVRLAEAAPEIRRGRP